MSRLEDCLNVRDFEEAARRRLPGPLYHYIAGGADDEITQRANTAAFDRYELVPRYLRDVRKVDMSRTLLGRRLTWPLILAPTGMSRMFHPDGEIGVAVEAARSGIAYSLSTMATTAIEDLATATEGAKIFQLYLLKDDGLNIELIDRCRAAGYDALCLTVDTIWAGRRERDLRTGFTVPPRPNLRSLLSIAAHPGWCLRYLFSGRISLPNVPSAKGGDLSTLAGYFAANMEQYISWDRVQRLIQYWQGPFAIKGLQSIEDMRVAASVGCSAIVLSNHGGRQLDGAPATIDLVADVADAVGDRVEIILDGGIRRGTHVVKALAMGAHGCMIGRPYVYALAAFGRNGVARALRLLKDEVERTLALLGCARLEDLDRSHIRAAGRLPRFLSEPPAAVPVPRLQRSQS